ncbi:hypothetical protein [Rhizocola hellebori]|nr:hypothetical protein [Rhizocola hellebori]
MDFADRFVTVADPLAAFEQTYFELGALAVLAASYPDLTAFSLAGWRFQDLQRHVTELLHEYAAVAEGVEYSPPIHVEWGLAMATAANRARTAFRRRGYVAERAPTPIGIQPGSVVVQHVVNELTVHCWDLATMMNRRNFFPDWLPERCQLSWQAFFDTYGRPAHNFDPEQPAPPDATPTTRLAAYLGRKIPDLPVVLIRPGETPEVRNLLYQKLGRVPRSRSPF